MLAAGRMDEPDVVATGLPGHAAASAMPAAGRSDEPGQAPPGLLDRFPSRVVGMSGGEAPTVTVHIGRVEVRSSPPLPTPQAPTTEAGPQPLSLDAYLDRRTGRSR
jgi:hypothetical protein